MNRTIALLYIFFALNGVGLYSQEKSGELAISRPEEKNIIVRSPDRTALIVVSEVPELTFESTRLIYATRPRGASEWNLLIEPGRQIITVRAPGYQPVKTGVINLEAKRAYSIKVSQVKAVPGTLLITSEPDEAEIRLNGAKIDAKTPYRLEGALPGDFNVEVQKEGYRPALRNLRVKSNEVTEWHVELTQTAVRVLIELDNKKLKEVGILIDGEPKGLAPGAVYLEPGNYQLVLQKPGYRFSEKVINVEFGPEEIRLNEKLIPIKQPIYKRWWFLTGSAAVFAGSAVLLFGGGGGQEPLTSEPPVFPGQ
ncbi:MAG: PEGA domain-containing protein [bacterium]